MRSSKRPSGSSPSRTSSRSWRGTSNWPPPCGGLQAVAGNDLMVGARKAIETWFEAEMDALKPLLPASEPQDRRDHRAGRGVRGPGRLVPAARRPVARQGPAIGSGHGRLAGGGRRPGGEGSRHLPRAVPRGGRPGRGGSDDDGCGLGGDRSGRVGGGPSPPAVRRRPGAGARGGTDSSTRCSGPRCGTKTPRAGGRRETPGPGSGTVYPAASSPWPPSCSGPASGTTPSAGSWA